MNTTPTLATRFANSTRVLRSDLPLSEEAMRQTAPSIFAPGKHASRSERYRYIPTIEVLRGLREEGFQPFMVAQGQSRIAGKTEYTKHMIRMRPGSGQIGTKPEANEIILINRCYGGVNGPKSQYVLEAREACRAEAEVSVRSASFERALPNDIRGLRPGITRSGEPPPPNPLSQQRPRKELEPPLPPLQFGKEHGYEVDRINPT